MACFWREKRVICDILLVSKFLLSLEGNFFYGVMSMKIELFPLEVLKFYENNPRRISDEAVRAVANSIREFGFKVPVIIDKDNVIVAGHTRLLAAQELGLKEIPCIVASDLTPEQVKAFRLADNKTSELTDWDFAKLDLELEGLDLDMECFGFALDLGNTENPEVEESSEVDIGEYSAEKFKNECPRCGYKF